MSTRISNTGIYISKDERFSDDEFIKNTIFSYRLYSYPNTLIPSQSLRKVEQELSKLFTNYNFYFSSLFTENDYTILSVVSEYNHTTKYLGLSLVQEGDFYKFREVEDSYVFSKSIIDLYKLDREVV